MNKYFLLIMTLCFSVITTTQAQQKDALLQVAAKERLWTGDKKYADYKSYPTRTVDHLPGFKAEPIKKNKYGGREDKTADVTGFFYVKKVKDRWWAVDPDGNLFINIAVNSIRPGDSKKAKDALQEKFGSEDEWINRTIEMLQSYGYNGAGSWSETEAIIDANRERQDPFVYTINWNFMSSYGEKRGGTFAQPGHKGYPNEAIFVFDPEFEKFCDEHAKQLLEVKDDPNLFGHFSDNELPFPLWALNKFLALPEDDHGHKAAKKWLKEQGINEDEITDDHRKQFQAYLGETYFSIVNKAIKKYDPNHMYLGSRLYSGEMHQPLFMKNIGKHMDIVSINYYNHWTPDTSHVTNWGAWADKPFIITEFYTKGEDTGMANQGGAGWIVKTQKDRGLFYQNYTLGLLESGNCVGWHYFRYQDNDPADEDAELSNRDANKGAVDIYFDPYEPMLNEMEKVNTQVYQLIDYFDNKKGIHNYD